MRNQKHEMPLLEVLIRSLLREHQQRKKSSRSSPLTHADGLVLKLVHLGLVQVIKVRVLQRIPCLHPQIAGTSSVPLYLQ